MSFFFNMSKGKPSFDAKQVSCNAYFLNILQIIVKDQMLISKKEYNDYNKQTSKKTLVEDMGMT